MMENVWIFLLDGAAYATPLLISFLLYRLYKAVFIKCYIRKFEEALTDQDSQRVEYMLLTAKKKQPRKVYPVIYGLYIQKKAGDESIGF